MSVQILLFAAGSSRRMRGADKLMQDVGGMPLLRRQALAALATGHPVIAVLPPDRPARRAALEGVPVTIVIAEDAATGLSASFRAGVAALPMGTEAAVMMLADMPEITTTDLLRLIKRWRQTPQDPARLVSNDGRPGSPVLFPARLFPKLEDLTGDQGGRPALEGEAITPVPCPDDRCLVDLDTPEDWAAWRAARA